MKPRVLIVSQGIRFPNLFTRFDLNRMLFKNKQYIFSGVASFEQLPDLWMEKIKTIILFCYATRISPDALDWLDHYLRQGGGMIALYPALISYPNSAVYSQILGIEDIKPHGVNKITITQTSFSLPGVEPVSPFRIRDIEVELALSPMANILYEGINLGKKQPAVWIHNYEMGRIWAMPVGKTNSSFQNPGIEKLIFQALDWCSQSKKPEQ